MTDIYDRAQEQDAMFLRHALEAQRRRAAPGNAANWQTTSAIDCQDENCGVPIPEARRRAVPGVQLCVSCQQRDELKKAGR